MTTRRIYLDHAATSWPKSEAVLSAMDDYVRNCGAAAGRGGYRSAGQAAGILAAARLEIAKLIGAADPSEVSFHGSGTLALNAAIGGLPRPGDHVVTTRADHNSVLRPIEALRVTGQVDVTYVDCDADGSVSAADVVAAVQPSTRLVVVTHASNVTGAVLPVAEIGRHLADHPAVYLVDAAQTCGWLPVDVREMGVDLLAAPGHKSIGGPLGTGLLYCRTSLGSSLRPTILGGTGSQSESLEMPTVMPDKLEAGNLNIAAIAGLEIAARDARARLEDPTRLAARAALVRGLYESLAAINGVTVVGQCGDVPVVSFQIDGFDPSDVAAILDAEFGIEVRSGFHCAALIHRLIGTQHAGTVRVSLGHETTRQDVDAVVQAVTQVASST